MNKYKFEAGMVEENNSFEEIKEAMEYCDVTYAEFNRALETGNDINGWVFDWV